MNRISILGLIVLWLLSISYNVSSQGNLVNRENLLASFDLQGHRGARGLLPENTIPGFLRALDIGVTTLEMDIAINAQGHAVLSHEAWMSAKICTHANGHPVTEDEEKSLRIYAMSDSQVASFDCGSRGHPDFSKQQPMAVSKPLLSEVLDAVAAYEVKSDRVPVLFNIEIKSRPDGDRLFHPEVAEFANILVQTLLRAGTLERSAIQSFDPRALEAVHKIDTKISTVLLVENLDGLHKNLSRLSFVPSIYSPYFKFVNADMLGAAHKQGIKVIPWTVNDAPTMVKLMTLGVDGLITDYPDMGMQILTEMQARQ